MTQRRIPIPFLVAALALAVLPPVATALVALQRDPAPAPAASNAMQVPTEVGTLEPPAPETQAADGDATAGGDAIATLPTGIPLPPGTPQTATASGEAGARTWTLVYPGLDRTAYDVWLTELLAAGLQSTFALDQGDLRSESLAGDGFTLQAQLVDGVGIALTVQEG